MSGPIKQRVEWLNTRQLIRWHDGTVRVREEIRTSANINGLVIGLYYATDDRTGLLHHFAVICYPSSLQVTIREWVDAWGATGGWVREALWVSGRRPDPEAISFCVVNGQAVFGAPGFPTMHGFLGGPLFPMRRGTSVSTDATTLPVPRGHVASWASRLVISDGQSLYFSDGLAPRAFVPGNVTNPAADVIHGLSVNTAGDLIVHCSDGIYSLARHAAARQIVAGVFSKVSDHVLLGPGMTASHRGRLWSLDRDGIRLVDVPSGPLIRLNDREVCDGQRVPIVCDDWRYGSRIFPVRSGFIITRRQPECAIFIDMDNGGERWPVFWAGCGELAGAAPHHMYGDVLSYNSSTTAHRHAWFNGDGGAAGFETDGGLRSASHPIGGSFRMRTPPEDGGDVSQVVSSVASVATCEANVIINGSASLSVAMAPSGQTGYTHNTAAGGVTQGRHLRTLSAMSSVRGNDFHGSVVIDDARPGDEVDPGSTVIVSIFDGKEGV